MLYAPFWMQELQSEKALCPFTSSKNAFAGASRTK